MVFETERLLELSTAKLRHVFLLDPLTGSETELSELADTVIPEDSALFRNRQPSEHVLYFGHAVLFGPVQIARLRLNFKIESGPSITYGRPEIEWRILAPKNGVVLKPVSDTTIGLAQSGEVVFERLPSWPEHEFRGYKTRWLTCRLVNGLPSSGVGAWAIQRLEIVVEVRREDLPLEMASNGRLRCRFE